jgi:hypothetical protein
MGSSGSASSSGINISSVGGSGHDARRFGSGRKSHGANGHIDSAETIDSHYGVKKTSWADSRSSLMSGVSVRTPSEYPLSEMDSNWTWSDAFPAYASGILMNSQI